MALVRKYRHVPDKVGIKEALESTLPHGIFTSELAPANGHGATPFSQQTVVLTKQAYIALTWHAHYWQAQYEQLGARIAALKAAIAAHQATIRDLPQRLYETQSEKSTRLKTAGAPPQPAPGSEDNSPAVQGTAAGTAPLSP